MHFFCENLLNSHDLSTYAIRLYQNDQSYTSTRDMLQITGPLSSVRALTTASPLPRIDYEWNYCMNVEITSLHLRMGPPYAFRVAIVLLSLVKSRGLSHCNSRSGLVSLQQVDTCMMNILLLLPMVAISTRTTVEPYHARTLDF